MPRGAPRARDTVRGVEPGRSLSWIAVLCAASACSFHRVQATSDDAGVDAEIPIDASLCVDTTPSCASPTVLRECRVVNELPTDTMCPWGCLAGPAAHCGLLKPSSDVLTAADLDPTPGLMDRTGSSGNGTINTSDGSITNLRPMGQGMMNGIEFQLRTIGTRTVAVFRFNKLTLTGRWSVRGANAVAIVSLGDVTVQGRLEVSGDCMGTNAGPGGYPGGAAHTTAAGDGGGEAGGGNNNTSGGGGGGYGADGGDGGKPGGSNPKGGKAWGDPEITKLIGGGGGGGGGDQGGVGGGGGGAVQIATNGKVTLKFDSVVQPSGINAGGCGGVRGNTDGGG